MKKLLLLALVSSGFMSAMDIQLSEVNPALFKCIENKNAFKWCCPKCGAVAKKGSFVRAPWKEREGACAKCKRKVHKNSYNRMIKKETARRVIESLKDDDDE